VPAAWASLDNARIDTLNSPRSRPETYERSSPAECASASCDKPFARRALRRRRPILVRSGWETLVGTPQCCAAVWNAVYGIYPLCLRQTNRNRARPELNSTRLSHQASRAR
jgi:hypothetical protein